PPGPAPSTVADRRPGSHRRPGVLDAGRGGRGGPGGRRTHRTPRLAHGPAGRTARSHRVPTGRRPVPAPARTRRPRGPGRAGRAGHRGTPRRHLSRPEPGPPADRRPFAGTLRPVTGRAGRRPAGSAGMTTTVADLIAALERAYPPALAASWDAIGLV